MKNNDSYGINISFSANYTDKDASAKVNITDTDGLDVSSEQSGEMSALDDVFADLFADISSKVLNARASKKQNVEGPDDDAKKLRADLAQLKKDHQSLKIDNNVLKLRLEALQKSYDEVVNANKKVQNPAPISKPSSSGVSNKRAADFNLRYDTPKWPYKDGFVNNTRSSNNAKETPTGTKANTSSAKTYHASTTAASRGEDKSRTSLSDLSDYISSLEDLYKVFFK